MNWRIIFLILAISFCEQAGSERHSTAAIDRRFKLSTFAKLKRVLRHLLPHTQEYALPRPPITTHDDDHSSENDVRTTRPSEAHRSATIHRTSSERSERIVKSGRYGASHRKDAVVTRTTTSIPSTISSPRRRNASRRAWSPVPYVIASANGVSKQAPSSRLSASNEVVEKSHSGFHTMVVGTTAFRRKLLRMIVEKSLARKSTNYSITPDVVHVSGVYTDPNNDAKHATTKVQKLGRPGYPRAHPDAQSHENQLVVDLPSHRSSSREDHSNEAFEPVFQVQPASQIHEDSNELVTTSAPAATLRRVEIRRPTTVIIHRKPPHAPPVFLRPTTTERPTPSERIIDEQRVDETVIDSPTPESNRIDDTTEGEEEDEEEVTLSPYARSKLLRYAHRQRKRRVRQDESIPGKFLSESLACRYCYVYWQRQDIQPRDLFTFCCRAKYRMA